jgi:hypothetical protein
MCSVLIGYYKTGLQINAGASCGKHPFTPYRMENTGQKKPGNKGCRDFSHLTHTIEKSVFLFLPIAYTLDARYCTESNEFLSLFQVIPLR